MHDDDPDDAPGVADPFGSQLAGLPDRLVDALSWLRTVAVNGPTEDAMNAAIILDALGLLLPADDTGGGEPWNG